jgi:hypothetical protein
MSDGFSCRPGVRTHIFSIEENLSPDAPPHVTALTTVIVALVLKESRSALQARIAAESRSYIRVFCNDRVKETLNKE